MTPTQLLLSAIHRFYQSSYIAQHSELFTTIKVKTEAVCFPEAPLRPLQSARSHDPSQPFRIKMERFSRCL